MCPEMLGKKQKINHFTPTQQSFRGTAFPIKVKGNTFLCLLLDGHSFLPFSSPSLLDAASCISICSVFSCTKAHTILVMSCHPLTEGCTNVNPGAIGPGLEVARLQHLPMRQLGCKWQK